MSPTDTFGAVEMRSISRRFGGTIALSGVDLTLRSGEIHAVLGSNGAGKSTLMKILVGLERPDEGDVRVMGETIDRFEPRALRSRGVAMVQQHFTLVPTLTGGENLVLARPEHRRLPDRTACRRRLDELVDRYGLQVRSGVPAGELSVGEQQRLELLRALDADARVLLLDEPTAVLTDAEAIQLLTVCRSLADEGRAVAFITHRLGEVFEGCDRVTLLREGRVVIGDQAVEVHSRSELASAMVGSSATGRFTSRRERSTPIGTTRLSLRNLSSPTLRGIDLDVRAGEVVGIAGVDGNGQADLESLLAGRTTPTAGTVVVDDTPMQAGEPRSRLAHGIAYVPSDRYRWGLVRPMDLSDNLDLGRVGLFRPRRRHRRHHARSPLTAWNVRSSGPAATAGSLSGGNAQKLVLARELSGTPGVVLACYPTRGLDPGASDDVATRLVERAENGAAVLWIGAELDELFAVSDRIFVLSLGQLIGPFSPPFDRERVGQAMAGMLDLASTPDPTTDGQEASPCPST